MAALNTIYNLVVCGLDAVLGTGTKGCIQQLFKTTSLWVVPDGFEFDGSETLDETYIQELKANGDLIILNDVQTFTDQSSEDVIETLENGVKQVTTLGLYEFNVKFIKGMAYHAALTSLNSFGSYNMLFVDRQGNIMGTKGANGGLSGFSLGMLQADRMIFASDSTGSREGITFQFTQRYELDTDYVFLSNTQIAPLNAQREDGVLEVALEMVTPADASTSIVVKAKNKQNGKPWTGGLTGDFLLTKGGTTLTQTVTEAPAGTYTFTVAANATNDVITARIYDSAKNRIGIIKDMDVYKSNTVTATIV